jgi:hypothetical protein
MRDPIHTTECEIMRTCMQTARSTSLGHIAAAHEGIALGCVRFGAPLTAVLPYAYVAGDCVSIFCTSMIFFTQAGREIPNQAVYKIMLYMMRSKSWYLSYNYKTCVPWSDD